MHYDTKKNHKLIILTIVIWFIPNQAWAILKTHQVNSGNEFYKEGQYEASTENYRQALKNDPESDIINFNIGTAYYKLGMFDKAIEHLQKSVLTDNDTLRQQAYYNLGNGLYRAGEVFIENELSKAIELFTMALKEYEKALQLNKEDKDAQFNYDFVKNRLERLKQQQKQQQQDQKNSKEKNQDNKQDQSRQPSSDQQNDHQQNNQNQENQNQQNNQDQQNKQDNQNTPNNQDQQNNPPPDQPNTNQSQDSQDQQNSSGNGQDEQQQNNQPDQENQDQNDESKNQQNQGNEPPNQDQEKEGSNSGHPRMTDQQINAGELTQKEAQMLLQDYQQRVEPKGLLNFNIQTKPLPVTKDW